MISKESMNSIEKNPPNMSSETSASKFMSIVNDDLLHEILIRIPDYDTAIQCRTVSKRWYSFISNPEYFRKVIQHRRRRPRGNSFIDQFFHRNLPCTLLFFLSDERFLGVFPDEFSIKTASFKPRTECTNFLSTYPRWDAVNIIRASLHDLLLVSRGEFLYWIVNPLIEKWQALPQAPIFRNLVKCIKCHALVCNPNNSWNYKVVLISLESDNSLENCKHYVITFSSETWQWNRSLFNFPLKFVSNVVATRDGILYWLEYSSYSKFEGIRKFNPFKAIDNPEECPLIDLPISFGVGGWEWLAKSRESLHLQAVQGRLRLSRWVPMDLLVTFKVWELRDSDASTRSWILVHDLVLECGDYLNDGSPVISFHPNDGDVLFMLQRPDVYRCKIQSHGNKKRLVIEEKVYELANPAEYRYSSYLSVMPLVHPPWPSPVIKIPSN